VFGGDAGKDYLPFHHLHQVLFAHAFKLHAGNHAQVFAFYDANPAGDALCGEAVIPGNHDDADAGVAALLHRFGNVHARRVHHGNHTKEGQVCLDRFHLVVVQFPRESAHGGRQYAQPLTGKVVVLRHDETDPLLAKRDGLAAQADAAADIQNFPDSAFDVSHALDSAVGPLHLNHGHALTARVEGQFGNVQFVLQVRAGIPGFFRQNKQGSLGRVSQHFPTGFGAVLHRFRREQAGSVALCLGQDNFVKSAY